MEERRKLVSLKYDYYKKTFDRGSILILILSMVLTLIEGIRAEVNENNLSNGLKYFFILSPIIISIAITFVSAFLKFKKYQDKIESMIRAIEKCIYTAFRIKKFQESIHFINRKQEYNDACNMYREEIYNLYNQSQSDLEHNLKFKDKLKYNKLLEKLNLRFKKDFVEIKKNEKKVNNNMHKLDFTDPENNLVKERKKTSRNSFDSISLFDNDICYSKLNEVPLCKIAYSNEREKKKNIKILNDK